MKSKKVAALVAALSIIAGGCYWFAAGERGGRRGDERFRPVAVSRGTVEDLVTAQGKLEPKEYVDVGTQVSGQLKEIHVQIGDSVERGELLAEIDRRVYDSQIEASGARMKSLQAQLVEQQAQLELAQQNLKRSQQLMAADAISQQALQESEAQEEVARSHVASIQAQMKELTSNLSGIRTNLEFTQIHAPMSGTITTLPARKGQTLNANQTAPTILQIANLDTMTVRSQVAEADVTRLKTGMSAYFTTLGNPDRRWQGTVRQILPSPEVLNDVVLYNVLIDVENKEHELMTGMSTQVFFVLGKAEDVPVIPAEALDERVPEEDNDSGKAYRVRVWQKGAGAKEVVVHTGLETRTQAQVTAGLEEGDRILLKRSVAADAPGGRERGGNGPGGGRGGNGGGGRGGFGFGGGPGGGFGGGPRL